ncbi:MAG: sigma-70 family RNA polymerase sigma factor [Phycisphaerales bacterium]|nr:sigma-70 family RNA polymerase sigma factor [Phycisphaerales bacterium]
MNPLTTSFVRRLRDRDEAAWFELWEVFGPVIRHQLHRWGRGAVGAETVRDLTQETLAALSGAIDRYDPARGARFSTWLLSIAKHVLGDELDRRNAQKRGSGRRPVTLDEGYMGEWSGAQADEVYERNIFQAKVYAAIRAAEVDCDFLQFQVYRMRVLDGIQGKDVSAQLGISAPTVTRHLQRVRSLLRQELATIVATYSFTEEERREVEEAGLQGDDGLFDEAIADIWHRQVELVREDELRATHG